MFFFDFATKEYTMHARPSLYSWLLSWLV